MFMKHRRRPTEPAEPGSWVTYGLARRNRNLPGFIALCPDGYPLTRRRTGSRLSARVYQGT